MAQAREDQAVQEAAEDQEMEVITEEALKNLVERRPFVRRRGSSRR